jgi:poly(beta-D-mannuronate) C5 epimerase
MKYAIFAVLWVSFASFGAQFNVSSITVPVGATQQPILPESFYSKEQLLASYSVTKDTAQTQVIRLSETKDLLKTIYSANFVRFAELQQQIPQGILITGGSIKLSQLSQRFPKWLTKVNTNTFLALIPIIIDVSGEFIIEEKQTLLLSQQKGSFVHNNGKLLVNKARVVGWNERRQSNSQYNGNPSTFRPFIIGFGGSESIFIDSSFQSLGFEDPSSYGITIRTATPAALKMLSPNEKKKVSTPPILNVIGSNFDDMFTGVYMDGAHLSQITQSIFTNSVINGIHIHSQSTDILIKQNDVSGTKAKHGIVVSNDSSNIVIVRNKTHGNFRSGLLFNQQSNKNLVAYNDSYNNGGDGISIYESNDILFYGNKVYQNKSHGIRVRGALRAKLHQNIILGNRGAAVYFNSKQPSEKTSGEVFGGLMVGNKSGAIFAENIKMLDLGALKTENNGSRTFRGDLENLTADIIATTWKDAKAIRITEKASH